MTVAKYSICCKHYNKYVYVHNTDIYNVYNKMFSTSVVEQKKNEAKHDFYSSFQRFTHVSRIQKPTQSVKTTQQTIDSKAQTQENLNTLQFFCRTAEETTSELIARVVYFFSDILYQLSVNSVTANSLFKFIIEYIVPFFSLAKRAVLNTCESVEENLWLRALIAIFVYLPLILILLPLVFFASAFFSLFMFALSPLVLTFLVLASLVMFFAIVFVVFPIILVMSILVTSGYLVFSLTGGNRQIQETFEYRQNWLRKKLEIIDENEETTNDGYHVVSASQETVQNIGQSLDQIPQEKLAVVSDNDDPGTFSVVVASATVTESTERS